MNSELFLCKIGAPLAAISELDLAAERDTSSPKPLDAFSRASRRTAIVICERSQGYEVESRAPACACRVPAGARKARLDTHELSVIDWRRDPNGEAT